MDTPDYIEELAKEVGLRYGNFEFSDHVGQRGHDNLVKCVRKMLLEARRHASREVLDIIQANESGLEKGYQEVAKKFSTE